MTTEEKAKAYDMALEAARKELGADRKEWDVVQRVLHNIFPVLAESEDERVRKELLDAVDKARVFDIDKDVADRWTAWLEKQKEDKWSPSEDEMGVLYKLCYISSRVTDEDDTNLTRLYQDLKRKYFNGHSFENMFPSEKQKESLHIQETCKENADSFTDEDERIRKKLVNFLQSPFIKENLTDEKVAPWIAYLEKQKDLDKMIVVSHEVWDNAISDAFENGKKEGEKQKEQKPAGCADDVVEEAEEYASKVSCGEYGIEVTEAYIAGVLSERNRGTWWSEEDEKILDELLDHCNTENATWYKWLKSLRPQKLDASKLENFDPVDVLHRIKKEWPMAWEKVVGKQEWSEEDEKRMSDIIDIIKSDSPWSLEEEAKHIALLKSLRPPLKDKEMKLKILKYLSTRCSSLEFEEVEDYLNNLRPSWKPSEEQMEAYHAILLNNTMYYTKTHEELFISLYNDLKKLM